MDSSSLQNIKKNLHSKELDPKSFCDWGDADQVEQTTISLKQIQISLENEMSQAIESHLLGKQKTLSALKDAVPIIQKQKLREAKSDPELSNILEMIAVKQKIDYCLGKLDSIINSADN